MTYYRPLLKSDLPEVLDMQLKSEDVEEAKASMGLSAEEALVYTLESSKYKWVIIHNDKIEAVFGISEVSPEIGLMWEVSTDAINNFKKSFLQISKQGVQEAQELYPILMNFVSENNTTTIKWLKYLGFTIEYDRRVILADGDTIFYRFYRTKGCDS
jgi:hypothetical protein